MLFEILKSKKVFRALSFAGGNVLIKVYNYCSLVSVKEDEEGGLGSSRTGLTELT